MEPHNLREWAVGKGRLFTCGRPGRGTYARARRAIGEDIIDRWVEGLPTGEDLQLVSLLGHKPDGYSEFEYYAFRSACEEGAKPTFQEWLHQRYGPRFTVHEFPTTDTETIPSWKLRAAKEQILNLLGSGAVIVVVDSAGSVRSSTVCKACGATLNSPRAK